MALSGGGDDDEIVIEWTGAPVVERTGPAGRVGDFHGEALRGQELGEPAANLAGAANHQGALSAAGAARGDAGLLLGSQRGANQYAHDRFSDVRRHAQLRGAGAHCQNHLAFAAVVSGRIAGGALDARDLATGGLSFSDQFQ